MDAAASAFIFGLMPLFTKILFDLGLNPIGSSFYRMSLALIFIFIYSKFLKIDMKLNKKEFRLVLLAALFFTLNSISLFASYKYINSGSATSIHFLYPVIIFTASAFMLKQRPSIYEILCIAAAVMGLFFIADFKEVSSAPGIIYAFMSAIVYSVYSFILERTKKIHPIKLLFYVNFFGSLMIFAFSLSQPERIPFDFTLPQFGLLIFYSCILTVGATFLYQKAVAKIGAKYTSILSTLEPVTSLAVGLLFLKENMTLLQFFAAVLIVLAALVLIKLKRN
ncbi:MULTISPECIES: DMT family transporter [unclassified Treponema]|uniref:DMT family transporter n=1 Tax=unclassified Treponema TaxID=2638727 RepID=UPI00211148D7|nr:MULTISPECIES: DMT family transporter [unclassified Treponema]